MHQKILKKILVELNKEKPDISYLKGMIEAVVDDEPVVAPPSPTIKSTEVKDIPKDEGGVLDEIAKARLAGIKDVALPE